MSDTDERADAKVVALRPATAARASERKWGGAVMRLGFSIIPSLLRAQRRLGLTPTQLAVLLQLADYWWDEARKPYPSKEALSERLGRLQRINTGESNLSPRRTKSDGDARLPVACVATGASKLPRQEDQFASVKEDNTCRLARVAPVE